MQKANQAVLLGLPIEGFDQLAANAIKLGRAMGIDALKSVDSLTLGVGRQSKLILDNLGIIVNAEDAQKKYAAANKITGRELTDTEKKIAFQTEAYKRINEEAGKLSFNTDTAATSYQKFNVAIENAKNKMAEALVKNESLNDAIKTLTDFVEKTDFTPFINGLAALATKMLTLIDIATRTAGALADVFTFNTDSKTGLGKLRADIEEYDKFEKRFKEIQKTLEQGGKDSVQSAGGLLTSLGKELSTPGGVKSRENLAELNQQYQDLLIVTNELGRQYGLVNKNAKAAFGPGAIAQIDKLTGRLRKSGEELDSGTKKGKKGLTEAEKAAKKAAEELERFGRKVDDAFDIAVPQRFVDLLNNAIVNNVNNDSGAAAALKAIAKEAQDAQVNIESLFRKAEELKKGIPVPPLLGTPPGQTPPDPENLPTFFGQEFEGGAFSQALASGIENAVLDGLSQAAAAISSGTDISVQQLSSSIGAAIGTAVGASFGPAGAAAGGIIGGVLGQLIGQVVEKFNEDTSGTKARKSVDKFFADVFSADRLTVIVGNELERIKDFVVNGKAGGGINGLIGGAAAATTGFVTGGLSSALGSQFGRGGPDSFADGTFDDALAAQQAQVQSFFAAVGTGFESLLGVSEEISGQVGAILFNNIGGNLVNLQAVIQATGKTFEEFGDAMFTAFFNGQIGLQQLQDGLVKLNELFQIGIPGQIGAIDVAVQNLQVSLQDDKGSRIIFNSLKSIGQEAIEAGKNLGQAAVSIASGLGLGAEKVALFLEAMKLAGIKSVQDLVEASNAQLAALGANILQITQGGTPTNSTVQVPTNSITSTPNFSAAIPKVASSPKTSGTNKAEQERKRLLEQLRNETQRLVTSSDRYNELLGKIGENEKQNTEIGRRLRELYRDQFDVLKTLQTAQEKYNKALEQGADGKKLGKLAKDLKDAKDAADKFGKSLNNAVKPDLTEIVKLITNVNQLGEVLNAVGVSADALKEVIVQALRPAS